MNQARSGRYHAEDFEAKRPIPWMALLALVLAVATMCLASAFYGYRNGYAQGRTFQASLPKPTTPAPVAALTQWQCTAQERKEYVGVCAARLRQELK